MRRAAGIRRILFCVGSTWLRFGLCCQTGPVFSVPPRYQISSHRRHGLGILCRITTAGYVMLTNTFLRSLFVVSVGTPGRLSLHRANKCPYQAWFALLAG